jgi:hypothetical protein
MTEAEWLEPTDHPWDMLEYLIELTSHPASERKWRLFVCAICREVWHLLTDSRSREAVQAGEAYADGNVSKADLQNACLAARKLYRIGDAAPWPWLASCAATTTPFKLDGILSLCNEAAASSKMDFASQCHLLRDVFNNPFRPVTFNASWRTSSVVNLASAMYEHRAFDCLPLLAGTLEEAGCRDAELLAHCRWSWPHVRGCWALDLVLGKG